MGVQQRRPRPWADQFLADLTQAVAKVKRFSLRTVANSLEVGLVRAAGRLLPAKFMSAATARSAALLGPKGGQLPKRSASMYGMMASLPHRGDLNELVVGVLDQLSRPELPS
ncbi:MAG: hypothetical protein M5U01_05115 [Ardenticatenaceae bacterium]|nr:hypothetical protein [Ardenticatenaceae bacterium]